MPTIRLIPLTSIALYILAIALNALLTDFDNDQWKQLLSNYVETPALITAILLGYLTIVLLLFRRLKLSIDVGITVLITLAISAYCGYVIFLIYNVVN
jgi:hypothetical protein